MFCICTFHIWRLLPRMGVLEGRGRFLRFHLFFIVFCSFHNLIYPQSLCSYPLETVRGRYSGGVKVADGYYLYHRSLNAKQISLLTKLANQLIGDDLDTMNSILVQFAP